MDGIQKIRQIGIGIELRRSLEKIGLCENDFQRKGWLEADKEMYRESIRDKIREAPEKIRSIVRSRSGGNEPVTVGEISRLLGIRHFVVMEIVEECSDLNLIVAFASSGGVYELAKKSDFIVEMI